MSTISVSKCQQHRQYRTQGVHQSQGAHHKEHKQYETNKDIRALAWLGSTTSGECSRSHLSHTHHQCLLEMPDFVITLSSTRVSCWSSSLDTSLFFSFLSAVGLVSKSCPQKQLRLLLHHCHFWGESSLLPCSTAPSGATASLQFPARACSPWSRNLTIFHVWTTAREQICFHKQYLVNEAMSVCML